MDVKVFVLFAVLLILCGHAESRRYWRPFWFRHYQGKDSSTEARSAFKDNGNNIFGFLQKSGRISDENKPSARRYGDNQWGFIHKSGRMQDENKPSALHSMDEKLTEDISDEDVENALDVLQKAMQYRRNHIVDFTDE